MPQRGTGSARRLRPADLLLVTGIALALRLLHLLSTRHVPFVLNPVGDARGYIDWALRIAGGDWMGHECFYQAPLYPYALAVIFTVLGRSVSAILVAQAAAGALTCAAVAWAGARTFDRRVGLVGGLLLACYAPAIFFDGIVQKTSLTGILTAGCVALVAEFAHGRRKRIAFALGLCAGLLALTRENALVWIALLTAWVVVATRSNRAETRRWVSPVLLVIGALLPLAVVGARNASVCGSWSPTTFQSGSNFYIGNGRGADGLYRPLVRGHETPEFERRDATELAEAAAGRSLSPREVSRFWWGRAIDDIAKRPGRWISLLGRKALIVLNAYEVPDVEGLHTYADYSPLIRAVSRVWHFGVLLPLAVLGAALTWRRWRELWIFAALALSMAAAVAAFFVLGRYRFPLVAPLTLFAAAGLCETWRALRSGRARALLRPGAVAALAAVVANWPLLDEARLNALGFMNLGVALAQQGDIDGATMYLRRAADDHPDFPEAQFNLAQALAQQGDEAGAIDRYRRTLALASDLRGVDFFLAQALERTGDHDGALRHYRRAVELDPQDAEAAEGVARLSSIPGQ